MKIESIINTEKAVVRQGETSLEVDISMLENPSPGDYVIVHAGFAIETLEEEDARETLKLFDNTEDFSYG
jgi:hydrogenase expression/formation protein HypC